MNNLKWVERNRKNIPLRIIHAGVRLDNPLVERLSRIVTETIGKSGSPHPKQTVEILERLLKSLALRSIENSKRIDGAEVPYLRFEDLMALPSIEIGNIEGLVKMLELYAKLEHITPGAFYMGIKREARKLNILDHFSRNMAKRDEFLRTKRLGQGENYVDCETFFRSINI
ncbi:MAG: hypothetical protein Q7S22_08335 [Candidatus Micrarchaeota archaeon]|nr:hypothetical protein [Candidatus Micrarchaeota archaeon]